MAGVGGLDDPLVAVWCFALLAIASRLKLLPQGVEMAVEVSELIWQVVGVRDDVEGLSAILFLHGHDVLTQSILASQLKTVGKVVDLLELVQVLIDIVLVGLTRPNDGPIVILSLLEAVGLQDCPDELCFTLHQLEQHLVGLIVHVLIENGALLEKDGALPIPHDQTRLLERLEGNIIVFQGILDCADLLRLIVTSIIFYF